MIISAVFSKPTNKCEAVLGKAYIRIRVWKSSGAGLFNEKGYEAEFFTLTQSFRKKMSDNEFSDFLEMCAGKIFKSVIEETENERITILANRRGEVKELRKPKKNTIFMQASDNRKKNYILKEGVPVDFLVKLGVMTGDGKVVAKKYDKFRQINRFLEFISDSLPSVKRLIAKEESLDFENPFSENRPLHIADFGCGKSYLTFALYYYLTEIENLETEITGLDLKADVISRCSNFADELGYRNLHFYVGDVAKFSYSHKPDIVVTLHACDTATDYALDFAVKNQTKAIFCVPCCQHEINLQLKKKNLRNRRKILFHHCSGTA